MKTNLTKFIFLITILINIKFYAQSQIRKIEPYNGIQIEGDYIVTLHKGEEGEILFDGNKEDIKEIECYVKREALIIRKKKTSWFNNRKSKQVYIRIPIEQISNITLSGSGKIKSEIPIKADKINTNISGAGDINLKIESNNVNGIVSGSGNLFLSGQTDKTNFALTGSGNIIASELKSNYSKSHITGSGNIDLLAYNEINGIITGSGNINCYGNPEKNNTKITGSGKVHLK